MKSVRRMRPDRLMEIMVMACSFSEARSTSGDSSADTNDIRANLVDYSDDESNTFIYCSAS